MNFTREPIIETVITPREGCKLVVRSSKGASQEDYYVDAVEVVSFGTSIFYRSLEKPKSFLLPVSDYEILELKETRMVLKNVGVERSIKIGGGKDTPPPAPQEAKEPQKKRRSRRRKSSQNEAKQPAPEKAPKPEPVEAKGGDKEDETDVSSPLLSRLLPPPATLIKEKLTRFKDEEILDANLLEGGEVGEEPLDVPATDRTEEAPSLPSGSSLKEEEKQTKKSVKEKKIPEKAAEREPEFEPLDEPSPVDEEVKAEKEKGE